MRLIHTADWHLGNQMHDIDRYEETQFFLSWLTEKIRELKADCLVIAGDVFDTVNPGTEARRQYYSFLSTLAGTGLGTVVIIGGNHDSALMLEAAGDLLNVLDIHVIGSLNNRKPEDLVVELKDSSGKKCGICLAVPFMRETELHAFDEDCPEGELLEKACSKVYGEAYQAALEKRGGENIPVIGLGHLYAAELEGRLSSSSSSVKTDDGVKVLDVLGTLGNVPPSVFPPAEYTALGHIHYSTMVGKKSSVRYSGSPFILGFDEALLPRYVLCADVNKDQEPEVQKIEFDSPYVFRRLSGSLTEIESEIRKLASSGADRKIFLELCYRKEAGVSAREVLEEAVASLPENIRVVSWKIQESGKNNDGSPESFEAEEVKGLDDRDIFTRLILSRSGLSQDSEEGRKVLEQFLPLFIEISESEM